MPKPSFIEILLWRSAIIFNFFCFFSRATYPLKGLIYLCKALGDDELKCPELRVTS